MYRGLSRGSCIGIIYTHPSRVGGIHALFSPTLYTVDDSLLFILNIFVANFFSLLGTLVVLSYSQVNNEQLFRRALYLRKETKSYFLCFMNV